MLIYGTPFLKQTKYHIFCTQWLNTVWSVYIPVYENQFKFVIRTSM